MSGIKEVVKEKYGQAARRVVAGEGSACCGTSPSSCCSGGDPITSDLYDELQKDELPQAAVLASLGCGNPTALAELKPGEVVLDLGSGGGIDVLLSAKRVSPGGKAYGLDMTDEMLALARDNQQKAGIENVEFLKGEIENIPLPDNSVDVTRNPLPARRALAKSAGRGRCQALEACRTGCENYGRSRPSRQRH